MNTHNTINERLRMARESSGYQTATDAARRFGWTIPTYLSHENNTRGFPHKKATTYAKAFKISLEWLLTGRGEMKGGARTVPLVGYVGAGGVIIPIDDNPKGFGLEEVEAPPEMGPNTVGVRIKGDSMFPAYEDGDTIYFDRHASGISPPPAKACIVCLIDGQMMVKLVRQGTKPDLFTLFSHNAPPINDVKIQWIAPIKWIRKL